MLHSLSDSSHPLSIRSNDIINQIEQAFDTIKSIFSPFNNQTQKQSKKIIESSSSRSTAYSHTVYQMHHQRVRSTEYSFIPHLVFGLAFDPITNEFSMFCNIESLSLNQTIFNIMHSTACAQLKSASTRIFVSVDEKSDFNSLVIPSLVNLDNKDVKHMRIPVQVLDIDRASYLSLNLPESDSKTREQVRKIRDKCLKPMRLSTVTRTDGKNRDSFGFSLMAGAFADTSHFIFRYSSLVRREYKTHGKSAAFLWDKDNEIKQNEEEMKQKNPGINPLDLIKKATELAINMEKQRLLFEKLFKELFNQLFYSNLVYRSPLSRVQSEKESDNVSDLKDLINGFVSKKITEINNSIADSDLTVFNDGVVHGLKISSKYFMELIDKRLLYNTHKKRKRESFTVHRTFDGISTESRETLKQSSGDIGLNSVMIMNKSLKCRKFTNKGVLKSINSELMEKSFKKIETSHKQSENPDSIKVNESKERKSKSYENGSRNLLSFSEEESVRGGMERSSEEFKDIMEIFVQLVLKKTDPMANDSFVTLVMRYLNLEMNEKRSKCLSNELDDFPQVWFAPAQSYTDFVFCNKFCNDRVRNSLMALDGWDCSILSFICSRLKTGATAPVIIYPWFTGNNDSGHWTLWLLFFGSKQLVFFDSIKSSTTKKTNQVPLSYFPNKSVWILIQRLWIQWFIWDYQLNINPIPLTASILTKEWNIQTENGKNSPFTIICDYLHVYGSIDNRICLYQGHTLDCGYFICMTAKWLENCFILSYNTVGIGPINDYQMLQKFMKHPIGDIPNIMTSFSRSKLIKELEENVITRYSVNSSKNYSKFINESSAKNLKSHVLDVWLESLRRLINEYPVHFDEQSKEDVISINSEDNYRTRSRKKYA
jgi:hypothetical protein